MFNGEEKLRIYDTNLLEELLSENKISYVHEKDYLTEVKSGMFYVKKGEMYLIDKICLKHEILLSNEYVSTENYSLDDKQHYILKKHQKKTLYLKY